MATAKRKIAMLVIVGMSIEAQDLRSHVGMGLESHCLLGQLKRI